MSFRRHNKSWITDKLLLLVCRSAAAISASILLLAIGIVILESLPALREIGLWRLLTDESWYPSSGKFGLAPMLIGTGLVTALSAAIATPLAVVSAVFRMFYAPQWLGAAYKHLIELLAGIPSVVFGFWGLTVLVPIISRVAPPGASLLAAALVLALMILPTVELIASSALASVPDHHYLGAQALGFSKERAIWKIIVPAALSGISAGVVLGVTRAAGETMAVMMVSGNIVQIPDNVFQPVRTLSANIGLEVAYAIDLHRASLFASGLIMVVMTLLAFCCAELIFQRRKWLNAGRTG